MWANHASGYHRPECIRIGDAGEQSRGQRRANARYGVRMLGWMVGDVINTRDEIKGLMQERLYVKSPPLGTIGLSDWVHAHREKIGRHYASELQRRFDRLSAYQQI